MTVNIAANKITFQANGATTLWNFNFPAIATQYIRVFITDTLGVITELQTSLYDISLFPTVDPNPTSQGGTVRYPKSGTPLAAGNQLTIFRDLPVVQSTSIANQSIIYPPVIEQEFDYLTLLMQTSGDDLSRAFRVGPEDPPPAFVPSVAGRANKAAFFDGAGNLTAGAFPVTGTFISAAMIPVVQAATIPLAQILFGLGPEGYAAISGVKLLVGNPYTITNSDKGKTLTLIGDFYTVTAGSTSGFDGSFQIYIINASARGKLINAFGVPQFMLWPGQFCILAVHAGVGWLVGQQARWRPGYPVNFFVNPTAGSDTNDGLVSGAGAFLTIQHAIDVVETVCDGKFTIVPEAGFHNVGTGLICSQDCLGADGYVIIGASAGSADVQVVAAPGSAIITVRDNAAVSLQNLYLSTTASDGSGVVANSGAVVTLTNVNFGQMTNGHHILVNANATVVIPAPYNIHGGGLTHIYASGAAHVLYAPGSVNIVGPMTFNQFFNFIFSSSLTVSTVPVFNNGAFVTGQQYIVAYNSTIYMGGGLPPGNSAGGASFGGVFA